MIQFHIIVSGKVQSVGYRYFSQMKAVQYEVTGWAKNLSNGSVEIMAQGSKDDLESFAADLRVGNPFSKIEDMEMTEVEITEEFHSFTIKY